MSKKNSLSDYGREMVNKELLPDWIDQQSGLVTNAMRQADRDEMILERPIIDANSFEDVEEEKFCQFCIFFRDKVNYLNQTVHYCAKNKVSVNTGTKCFNGKFQRA